MTPTFRPHSLLNGHLSLYALAGGSLAALCPTLSATPIRYNTDYIFSIPVSDTESILYQYLDLNGDETNDFQIRLRNHSLSTDFAYSAAISGIEAAGSAVASSVEEPLFPQPFGENVWIGPDYGSWIDSPAELVKREAGYQFGLWPYDINQTRYEGVRFQIGGQTHYGWIATSANISDTAVELRISGWAYESTPNTAIQTGEAGPVATPEPSSLALFALGAAGIAAVMRRRRSRA